MNTSDANSKPTGRSGLRRLELLAPARDAATGRRAILHGADAVYIGAPSHGARAAAANSLDDIAGLAEMAHLYHARVYVTVNTLILDSELASVERMIRDLYRAGADALIVQDPAILRLDLPPIDLHASTQCDIRTPARAQWLAAAGFSQLVVPRELTLDETARMRAALPRDVRLEAFVHGALCVSYSGDCQASCVATGRSANRGECAQLCRLPYDLVDSRGRTLVSGRHLLSLRDLNRSAMLGAMVAAGVDSFKIEGRLKDEAYVANVTAAYSSLLDRMIEEHNSNAGEGEQLLARASDGRSVADFTPDLSRSFNRGFTTYFTSGPLAARGMASLDTPKWRGMPVATVKSVKGNMIVASVVAELNNGDGLGYMGPDGVFAGFRLNRVDGDRLYAATPLPRGIGRGTRLYRNSDAAFERLMARQNTARRTIDVALSLRLDASERPVMTATDATGITVTVADTEAAEPARNAAAAPGSAAARRRPTLTRTGDTIYRITEVDDTVSDDYFLAMSRVTELRRRVLSELDRTRLLAWRPLRRRRASELPAAGTESDGMPVELDMHANVANRLTRAIYEEGGHRITEGALETLSAEERRARPRRVMTTRYCIRRELGACLCGRDKTDGPDAPARVALPAGPLRLVSRPAAPGAAPLTFDLRFDCAACRMEVWST